MHVQIIWGGIRPATKTNYGGKNWQCSFTHTHNLEFLALPFQFQEYWIPTTFWSRHWGVVVYFDQQMHACACVPMVENDKKHLKMMKKVFFFMRLTWASRAHGEKGNFFIIFKCFYHFRPCKHMHKHAFAGWNTQQGGLEGGGKTIICFQLHN